MMNSLIMLRILAILAISCGAAKPFPKTGLIQSTLRGTPISTAPQMTPGEGSGPPPEQPRYARKPGDAVVVIWPEHSNVPVFIQTCLACVWILILASLPFIIPVLDKRDVTKTQKVVGAAMLTVLFGGLYLFTNIILFESVHFEQTRPLTIIECIYFMSQVITTVGYGDIVPAKVRGQVFVGMYVLGALFIIAMLVSEVTTHVSLAAQKYRERLLKENGQQQQQQQDKKDGKVGSRSSSVHDLIVPQKPSPRDFFISIACFAVIDICWICFFSNYPGEQKTMFQALYMSVITLSTVGLGAFTPLTEGGMIFGAFFMLFGSAALVSSVSNFCALVVKMNEFERFSGDSKIKATKHLKQIVGQGAKQVNQMQFFEWSVLNQKLMSETQIKGVLEAFDNLQPVNGVVDFRTVEASMGVILSPRQ